MTYFHDFNLLSFKSTSGKTTKKFKKKCFWTNESIFKRTGTHIFSTFRTIGEKIAKKMVCKL